MYHLEAPRQRTATTPFSGVGGAAHVEPATLITHSQKRPDVEFGWG